MPARLQQTGQGAYYAYLPRRWFLAKSLKRGALLDIYEGPNYLLVSHSLNWKGKSENPIEITVTQEPSDLYWRILSSYIHGCLMVRLVRDNRTQFSTSQLIAANETLQKLRGIEPTINQDEIEYVDITDYEKTKPFEELGRMFKAIAFLFHQNRLLLEPGNDTQTFADSLHQHWISEKEQINPISFYIHRIVNVILEYPNLSGFCSIPSLTECQFIGVVTYILEKIGDTLYAVAQNVAELCSANSSEIGQRLNYPPEHIKKRLHKVTSTEISRALLLFRSRSDQLFNFFNQAEKIVLAREPGQAIRLAQEIKMWRNEMTDRPAVERLDDLATAKCLFAIQNRLAELSSYVESLANRTCQFYYV
jgi:hypothetical protein